MTATLEPGNEPAPSSATAARTAAVPTNAPLAVGRIADQAADSTSDVTVTDVVDAVPCVPATVAPEVLIEGPVTLTRSPGRDGARVSITHPALSAAEAHQVFATRRVAATLLALCGSAAVMLIAVVAIAATPQSSNSRIVESVALLAILAALDVLLIARTVRRDRDTVTAIRRTHFSTPASLAALTPAAACALGRAENASDLLVSRWVTDADDLIWFAQVHATLNAPGSFELSGTREHHEAWARLTR